MNKSQTSQQQNPQITPQKLANNNHVLDHHQKPSNNIIKPNSNNNLTTNNNVLDQQKLSNNIKPINNSNLPSQATIANDNSKIMVNDNKIKNGKVIWDCGSSLYDSFERDSFRKQLDSAIINSSRTISMPRLPSQATREQQPPPQVSLPQQTNIKKAASSKLSRSFQKLIRSLFRASKPNKNSSKPNSAGSASPDPWFFDSPVSYEEEKDNYGNNGKKVDGGGNSGKYYVVYEKPNISGLTAIPEVPEVNLSPEIGSLVRKTMSDRFTAVSRGIYCA